MMCPEWLKMNIQNCINDLLIRGTEDIIQAAEVASVAITVGGAKSQDEIRDLSLELIRNVVQQGLMEIGDAVGIGHHPTYVYERVDFRVWDLSFEAAMARVEREWKALGRPNLGDICWLRNTEKGNELSEQLLKQRGSSS
ncbi:MAG: hypothetical protein V1871_05170 [Planctomycetota bacterium]